MKELDGMQITAKVSKDVTAGCNALGDADQKLCKAYVQNIKVGSQNYATAKSMAITQGFCNNYPIADKNCQRLCKLHKQIFWAHPKSLAFCRTLAPKDRRECRTRYF
jgi:hypothetical protein